MTMIPPRPLRLPTYSEVRQAFDAPRELPADVRKFMATIAPMLGKESLAQSTASLMAMVASEQPDRKVKSLDKLLGEINFPREVIREINTFIDHVSAPPEYRRIAERIVPPLENLTGAMLETEPPFPVFKFTEPMSELQRLVYDEAMTSFVALRDDHVRTFTSFMFCNDMAPDFLRRQDTPKLIDHVIKRIEYLDFAAGICGVTLHNPYTWEDIPVDRMKVIATLNDCQSRADVLQHRVDNHLDVVPHRHVLGIIDDAIIEYCQRTVRLRSEDLRPLAFWQRVLHNSPLQLL